MKIQSKFKKNSPLGFIVIEPKQLKFKHEAETTMNKKKMASK